MYFFSVSKHRVRKPYTGSLDGRGCFARDGAGVYLPVQLNACIMVGGLIRLALDKMKRKDEEEKKAMVSDGVLFCSGMIAGEGLVGILLALLAVFGWDSVIDLSARFGIPAAVSNVGGLVLFGIIILTVLKFSLWKKRAK